MIPPDVGVMRAVIDPDRPEPPTISGLRFSFAYDDQGQAVSGPITLYMIDAHRLTGLFDAARLGATNDDLILALDALALETD